MDLEDGWIRKFDFQWIRSQLFSQPFCIDYTPPRFEAANNRPFFCLL